jgi:hypothetical protein
LGALESAGGISGIFKKAFGKQTGVEGKPSDINQLIFRHNGKSRHLWSLASQSSVLYEYNKEHIPFSFSRNAATSPNSPGINTRIPFEKEE